MDVQNRGGILIKSLIRFLAFISAVSTAVLAGILVYAITQNKFNIRINFAIFISISLSIILWLCTTMAHMSIDNQQLKNKLTVLNQSKDDLKKKYDTLKINRDALISDRTRLKADKESLQRDLREDNRGIVVERARSDQLLQIFTNLLNEGGKTENDTKRIQSPKDN